MTDLTIEAAGQAISTLGFPILAFLLVYLDLRRIIEKNTAVLNQLCVVIGSGGKNKPVIPSAGYPISV